MSPFIPPPLPLKLPHRTVGPRVRHTSYHPTIMPYSKRGIGVSKQIYTLFSHLNTQTYDEVAPKIEYWIEWALTQQLTTADKLVEEISSLAWTSHCSPASVGRFLKEFRDSSRRSTQAKYFVDGFCTRVFRWFAAASAEDLAMNEYSGTVANRGGCGFIEAASFVGHLIDCSLLDHALVRLHLIKPLTTHYYPQPRRPEGIVRVNAICRLFVAAGSTLVQGLLEPEDVRVCFEILGTQPSRPDGIEGLPATKLQVQCATHRDAPYRNLLTRGQGTSGTPCDVVGAE